MRSVHSRQVGIVLVLLLLTLVIGCGGTDEPSPTETASSKPSDKPAQPSRREIWMARAVKAMGSIKDPEDRSTAAQYTSLTLAETGNYQQAKQLVQEFVSDDEQGNVVCLIASAQSMNGDFEQAMATAEGISNPGGREAAISLIAMRQAQRGQVGKAISLMREIKQQWQLDFVRGSVAKAQAKAGDLSAAKTTAAKIVDNDNRRNALKDIAKIKTRKDPPLDAVDSMFIRRQLQALLLFSKAGAWSDDPARAIIVAKEKNAEELDRLIEKTITAVEKADQPASPTVRLLLCVALSIADRPDEARAMAQRFLVAANGDIVGVSDLFGKPVLAYLFTKLGMKEELKKVLVTEPDGFGNNMIMQAVGVAEAEDKNWEGLETRYKKLTAPMDRVDFSCGVLIGLQAGK